MASKTISTSPQQGKPKGILTRWARRTSSSHFVGEAGHSTKKSNRTFFMVRGNASQFREWLKIFLHPLGGFAEASLRPLPIRIAN